MSAHSFDTLSSADELQAAGFTEKQAKASVKVISSAIDENLATKIDILLLKKDIKELEYKLTIRLGGMIIGSFGATVATLGFLMNWMLKGVPH